MRENLSTLIRRKIFVFLAAILAVLLLTVFLYHMGKNTLPANRVIIFAYQTNVTGSEAENWAKNLKARYPDVKYIAIRTFLFEGANLVSYANGWDQIVTLLANKQGDILLLDRERFDFMVQNDYLMPLPAGSYGETGAVRTDKNGNEQLFGLEIDGLLPYGLQALDNLENESDKSGKTIKYQTKNDNDKNTELYAAVYKGASDKTAALKLFSDVFGGSAHE